MELVWNWNGTGPSPAQLGLAEPDLAWPNPAWPDRPAQPHQAKPVSAVRPAWPHPAEPGRAKLGPAWPRLAQLVGLGLAKLGWSRPAKSCARTYTSLHTTWTTISRALKIRTRHVNENQWIAQDVRRNRKIDPTSDSRC